MVFVLGTIMPVVGWKWSRAQYLVGGCANGDRHPRRLDDADQESILLFPPPELEAGFFLRQLHYQQLFYVYAAISLVPRRLPDLWRIQDKIH